MKPPKNCPMCGSKDDWILINQERKGYNFLKSFLALIFFGWHIGVWAGLLGRKTKLYTCKRCYFSMEYKR